MTLNEFFMGTEKYNNEGLPCVGGIAHWRDINEYEVCHMISGEDHNRPIHVLKEKNISEYGFIKPKKFLAIIDYVFWTVTKMEIIGDGECE